MAKEKAEILRQIEEEKSKAKETKAKSGSKSPAKSKKSSSPLLKELEKKLAELEKKVIKFTPFAIPKSFAFPTGRKITNEEIYLYIFSALAPIAESGFARKWSLERKIAEFTGNTAIGDMLSFDFFRRSFMLSEAKLPKLTASASNEDLHLLASNLAGSENSWVLLGANEFNGIKWFNKEKMESSLDLYKKILLLKASAAKKTAVEAMFKKLNAAQKKAEYKCENFVMAFESKKK